MKNNQFNKLGLEFLELFQLDIYIIKYQFTNNFNFHVTNREHTFFYILWVIHSVGKLAWHCRRHSSCDAIGPPLFSLFFFSCWIHARLTGHNLLNILILIIHRSIPLHRDKWPKRIDVEVQYNTYEILLYIHLVSTLQQIVVYQSSLHTFKTAQTSANVAENTRRCLPLLSRNICYSFELNILTLNKTYWIVGCLSWMTLNNKLLTLWIHWWRRRLSIIERVDWNEFKEFKNC